MKLEESDAEQLRPTIEKIVAETLAKIEVGRSVLPADRLCLTEAEAAQRLGLPWYALRDERQKGRIVASKIAGRKVVYTMADLLTYLATHRTQRP
jgi:hypothetical protein